MFTTKDNGKIVSSSIFLYKPDDDSFLLIKEMRKKTPQSMYKEEMTHLFGGKVEREDINPLYTAIREFMEEIGANDKSKIDNMYNELSKLNSIARTDVCVSVRNSLYNTFYIVNISLLPINTQRNINSLIQNVIVNESMKGVFFHQRNKELINPTSLLASTFSKLPSVEFLSTC